MTTLIAIKRPPMMISDTLANDSDRKQQGAIHKIRAIRLPWASDSVVNIFYSTDGMKTLAGYCGETQCGIEFFRWCELGLPFDRKPFFPRETGFNGVLLFQTGRLFVFNDRLIPMEEQEEYYCIGSGRNFAYGAVEGIASTLHNNLLLTPLHYERALEVAADLDLCSGLPVHVVEMQ